MTFSVIAFHETRFDAGDLERHLRPVSMPDKDFNHKLSLERKNVLNSSG